MNEQPDPGRSWEEILAEPTALIREDGWRSVRQIEEISPRPQAAPVVLPPAETWVSLKLPREEDTETESASADPLPSSLMDQLSLTWASRTSPRRRRVEDESADLSDVDLPEPAEEALENAAPPPPQPTPAWRRPIDLAFRLLRRSNRRGSVSLPDQPEDQAPTDGPTATPSRKRRTANTRSPDVEPAAVRGEQRGADQEQPSLGEDTSLPLVLARQMAPGSSQSSSRGELAEAAPEDRPYETGSLAPETATPTPAAPGLAPKPSAQTHLATMPVPAAAHGESPGEPPARPDRLLGGPLQLAKSVAARLAPHRSAGEAPRPDLAPEPQALVHRIAEQREPVGVEPERLPAVHASLEPEPNLGADDTDEGEPLSPVLRDRMEGLLDVPLREVRIFRNAVSRRLSSRLRADALSFENEVHLAPGKGDPSLPSGQGLLAHELSHVAAAQQPDATSLLDEETEALRLEHAVRQFDAPDTETLALSTGPFRPLRHSRPTAEPSSSRIDVGGISSPHFGGEQHDFRGAGAPRPSGVALAPEDRPLPAMAPTARDSDSEAGPSLSEDAEASLIERAVEAVLRRIRRDTALERERRGAFRSEIGG